MALNTEPKKRKPRGFAAMKPEDVLRICALGGKKTAKRHGKAYMARIGRNGRLKRMRMERKAKAEKIKELREKTFSNYIDGCLSGYKKAANIKDNT